MASEVESRKAIAQADAVVRRRLADVCRRLRRLEVLAALLVLGVVVCGYALGMALCDLLSADRAASPAVHWAGFGLFVLLTLLVLGRLALIGLRRVNPYYAARQL